jgi:predicted nuclease with TOPRIM domain
MHCIHQVVEAPTLRWMFEAGMTKAAREALVVLRHEANEQMVHSQYCHFPSRAEEGTEAMILPAGGHDRVGCFTDEVKLTRALVRDLDEAIREVKLLGEHEEELSQKITELEALCKKLRGDTQRLEEEKATLESMVKSHDELLMEIARETGLDWMGEDVEDDGEDEDAPPAVAPKDMDDEGPMEMIP